MIENNKYKTVREKYILARELGLGLSEIASYIETTEESLVEADKINMTDNYMYIYKMAIEAGYSCTEAEKLADCTLYLVIPDCEADRIKELVKGDIDEIR